MSGHEASTTFPQPTEPPPGFQHVESQGPPKLFYKDLHLGKSIKPFPLAPNPGTRLNELSKSDESVSSFASVVSTAFPTTSRLWNVFK